MNRLRGLSWRKLLVVLILLAVIWWGWRVWQSRGVVEVESTRAVTGNIRESLVLSGEVTADEHVVLTFQGSGLLSWVGVKVGDQVKKYQAIASLDQRSLQKNLEKQLNLYMTNRWDFEQKASDYDEYPNGFPEMEQRDEIKRILDKSQFGLNNAVIDVELVDLAKRLSVLSTPIAGIVTRVSPEFAGVNVGPASAVFEVINPDTLYFKVSADQSEVVALFEGQSVDVVLDSFDEQSFTGVVKQIGFIPQQGETGTVYEVQVMVPAIMDLKGKLRMGMTGDAEFVVADKQNVVIIPQTYVRTDGTGDYVLVNEAGEKRYVKLGVESDSEVEIVEGLTTGEQVFNLE